jgi:colicin import membrane protein
VQREEPKAPEPVKPAPKPEPKPAETAWKPNKPKISLDQITRKDTSTTRDTTAEKRVNERLKTIESAMSTIRSSASAPITMQELRGPGGGGVPYAGFRDALISAYMRAWLVPGEAANENAKVVVTITLRRNGDVISSRIQTRSGISALDASVQRALDKVTFVAPFPDTMKETQKTFWLEFDPKAKRMMG